MSPTLRLKAVVERMLTEAKFWYCVTGSRRNKPKLPDMLCCSPCGDFVVIEVRTRPSQKPLVRTVIDDIRGHGGHAFVVHPYNLADLKTYLASFHKNRSPIFNKAHVP